MTDLRPRLRELADEAPPDADGFAAALHRRLADAGAPDPLSWWRRFLDMRPLLPALSAGVVAAAAVAFVVTRAHPPAVQTPVAVATTVPATKVAVVRVNLSAEVAVANADIKVELPEGLVFWANGEELKQRRFEWSQPLRAGDNEIPIAVRGLKPGRYKMTLSALIGSERVEDEVLLQVTDG
jgi:hypothetical protein